MTPKIITAAERKARRGQPIQAKPHTVRWRKKGCKTCKPIVVPVRNDSTQKPQ